MKAEAALSVLAFNILHAVNAFKDVDDHALWSTKIEPRMEKWSRGRS